MDLDEKYRSAISFMYGIAYLVGWCFLLFYCIELHRAAKKKERLEAEEKAKWDEWWSHWPGGDPRGKRNGDALK